ncbi:TPA: hypothetical protein ACGTRQ_003790 [Vibrio parahaemolyticus]
MRNWSHDIRVNSFNHNDHDYGMLTIDNVESDEDFLAKDELYSELAQSETLTLDVLANDTEQDNDPLTLTAAFSESGNTEINSEDIIFTPNSDF